MFFNFIIGSSHSCTIFIFISYYLCAHVMLILILVNVQYLQNVNFSFEKVSKGQNLSLSFYHLIKKIPWRQIPHSSYLLMLFGKPWTKDEVCKTIWNSFGSVYLNILEKRNAWSFPHFCIVLKTMKLLNECVICFFFHYLKSILGDDLLKEYINPVVFVNLKYMPYYKKFNCFNWLPLKHMLE